MNSPEQIKPNNEWPHQEHLLLLTCSSVALIFSFLFIKTMKYKDFSMPTRPINVARRLINIFRSSPPSPQPASIPEIKRFTTEYERFVEEEGRINSTLQEIKTLLMAAESEVVASNNLLKVAISKLQALLVKAPEYIPHKVTLDDESRRVIRLEQIKADLFLGFDELDKIKLPKQLIDEKSSSQAIKQYSLELDSTRSSRMHVVEKITDLVLIYLNETDAQIYHSRRMLDSSRELCKI